MIKFFFNLKFDESLILIIPEYIEHLRLALFLVNLRKNRSKKEYVCDVILSNLYD